MSLEAQWIGQTVMLIIIGIIGYLIKQTLNEMKTQISKNNDRIEEVNRQLIETINEKMVQVDCLQKEFQGFKEKVVDEFVKKNEHNRVTGEIMNKLDKIFDILMKMKGATL